jgi:hypothetical protein
VVDYTIPGTEKILFKQEELQKYDLTYFLENSQASTFLDFKNEVEALKCPFTKNIK